MFCENGRLQMLSSVCVCATQQSGHPLGGKSLGLILHMQKAHAAFCGGQHHLIQGHMAVVEGVWIKFGI